MEKQMRLIKLEDYRKKKADIDLGGERDRLNFLKELLAQGQLERARQAADHLLMAGSTAEEGAHLIAKMALEYRAAGRLTEAVAEMNRSLYLCENDIYRGILGNWECELPESEWECPNCRAVLQDESKECPQCGRIYCLCTTCGNKCTLVEPYCRRCGCRVEKSETPRQIESIRQLWSRPCPQVGRALFPPAVIGDLIVFSTKEGSLVALQAATGEKEWELPDALNPRDYFYTFFSYPLLYILSPGKAETVDLNFQREVIYQGSDFLPADYALPLEAFGSIFFPARNGLLVHRFGQNTAVWQSIKLGDEETLRSPILFNNTIWLLSSKGRQLTLTLDGEHLRFAEEAPPLEKADACGAPVCWQGCVAYEALIGGQRQINFIRPDSKLTVLDLPDITCESDDKHFSHMPFIARDGLLYLSDEDPLLYLAEPRQGLRHIRIEGSVGPVNITGLEHTFSSYYEPYFFSKFPGGFLIVNIQNPKAPHFEFLIGDELISAPVLLGKRLLLVGLNEIRCYFLEEID